MKLAKFLRTPFLQNTSGRLLLSVNSLLVSMTWENPILFCCEIKVIIIIIIITCRISYAMRHNDANRRRKFFRNLLKNDEENFCFISVCSNSFNCKLKKLINEKIIIFYSPTNAFSYFHWHVSPFHWVQKLQIPNFLLIKTRANVQVCVIVKTRCFYSFNINSQ